MIEHTDSLVQHCSISIANSTKPSMLTQFSGGVNAPQIIFIYCQVSHITRTLVGNKIVNHSDVVGASPVGAAPTTSSFST